MKVALGVKSGGGTPDKLVFTATPDTADIEYNKKIRGKLNLREVEVDLVPGQKADDIHPDLIGLAVLLTVAPLSKRQVELNIPVSETFKRVAREKLIHLEAPIDHSIQPREGPADGKPGLAFSGGVDSCAALILMPRDTVPVFLHREAPPVAIKGNYFPEAALHSCNKVAEAGYNMQRIKTSFEYIRKPVGNPVDWSNSIPAVVNAGHLGLSSISFGLIAESAFWTGGPYYSDLASRTRYSAWAPLFGCCSLPLSFPTAALSEVLTTKICLETDVNFAPQSCVRGQPGEPCGECFKCYRKAMVERSFRGGSLAARTPSEEVSKKLLEKPIHHEIVIAWALGRLRLDDPVSQALSKKIRSTMIYGGGLSFLDRYYPRGLDYIPDSFRNEVRSNIERYADPMTSQDMSRFHAWDANSLVNDPSYDEGHRDLESILAHA